MNRIDRVARSLSRLLFSEHWERALVVLAMKDRDQAAVAAEIMADRGGNTGRAWTRTAVGATASLGALTLAPSEAWAKTPPAAPAAPAASAVSAAVQPDPSAPSTVSAAETPAEATAPQSFAIHIQATVVEQANAAFRSPYRGPESLDPTFHGRETADVTVYGGLRL